MSQEAEQPKTYGLGRTSLLSGIATASRLASGFVANKFLAVYLGAPGIALIGQLQNVLTIATNVGSAGIQMGVVRYASEYSDDAQRSTELFSTSLRMTLGTTLLTALGLAIGAPTIAERLLGDAQYTLVVYVCAATLVFFVLHALLLSALNGRRDIAAFVRIQLIGSAIAVALAATLPRFYGTMGALLSVGIAQTCVFAAAFYSLAHRPWFDFKLVRGAWSAAMAGRLGHYSLMALTSTLVLPLCQIAVRSSIATNASWAEAGQWQAVTRISDSYLMFLTTTLSVYYVPKLASLKSEQELRRELYLAFRTVVPVASVLALAVYVARRLVIRVLYSADFDEAESLFAWQLVGDVVKMASWILANIMQARGMTRTFIFSEVVFGISYAAGAHLLVPPHGVSGAVEAFTLSYILYLGILIFVFRRLLLGIADRSSP